jgi:hypothetical protein
MTERIMFRAWYRIPVARYWYHVIRPDLARPAVPLLIQFPKRSFFMDAYYDPGPLEPTDGEPTVVFRGYLIATPPPRVLEILRRTSFVKDPSLKETPDGLGSFPGTYGQYIRGIAAEVSELSTNAYNLLRWRHKTLEGPTALTIAPASLFWAELPDQSSTEGALWQQVAAGIHSLDLPPGGTLDVSPDAGSRIDALLAGRADAPLGHALLREAWQIRDSNIRSALVMAVAAAESGAKEFISTVAPDTSWLLENLPSPPLDKILKSYLPHLPSRSGDCQTVSQLPTDCFATLRRAVEVRNKIVHRRSVNIDQAALEGTLRAVVELLYFLDYHLGYGWARADAAQSVAHGIPMGNA